MKVLTFDIEDWFHVLDHDETRAVETWDKFPSRLEAGVEYILQTLEENNQRATFFCLGWVAEKHPNIIRLIDRAGFHIGSHSFAHQLAYDQTRQEFQEDLKRSLGVLQDTTGKPIDSYRAPGFSITSENLWAFEILSQQGIEIDSSLFPASRAHGGLPDFGTATPSIGLCNGHQIKLFPINTRTILGRKFIYSGGGYFRLLPNVFIQKWFCLDDYVMTYFHPRDFDAEQPVIPGLTPIRRFKSYVGLKSSRAKLAQLLSTLKFVDLRQATDSIIWEDAKKVDLTSLDKDNKRKHDV